MHRLLQGDCVQHKHLHNLGNDCGPCRACNPARLKTQPWHTRIESKDEQIVKKNIQHITEKVHPEHQPGFPPSRKVSARRHHSAHGESASNGYGIVRFLPCKHFGGVSHKVEHQIPQRHKTQQHSTEYGRKEKPSPIARTASILNPRTEILCNECPGIRHHRLKKTNKQQRKHRSGKHSFKGCRRFV